MKESTYVFQSSNEYLLGHKIEEKIKELDVDPFNVMKYDLLESKQEDVLEDMMTIPFFSEKKVIVIKNIQLLDKVDGETFQNWQGYFENPNPDVIVLIELLETLPKSSPTQNLLMKY